MFAGYYFLFFNYFLGVESHFLSTVLSAGVNIPDFFASFRVQSFFLLFFGC